MSNTKTRSSIRDDLLDTAQSRTLLMGILNTTPDSFSDGGQFNTTDIAVSHAQAMIAEGADIIDIGGESTRPGATIVSAEEEISRTEHIIRNLFSMGSPPLSIDTYKASVARRACEAGCVIINDVWGMTRDEDMARTVADTGSIVVVTYNRGQAEDSINLVDDAHHFFDHAFDTAARAGIPREHIWLDPGVGFSKTLAQNFEILRRLDVLCDYERPILVGLSRKSFIGLTLDRAVDQRLPGTLAANLAAMHRGAGILRVHDIAAHRDALIMHDKLMSERHD